MSGREPRFRYHTDVGLIVRQVSSEMFLGIGFGEASGVKDVESRQVRGILVSTAVTNC